MKPRERTELAGLLERTGTTVAAAVVPALDAYLDSLNEHWERQGFPVHGFVEDFNVWARAAAGHSAPPPSSRDRVRSARNAPRVYRKGPDDVDELEPVTRPPIDPEAAAAAAARARELAIDRVRAEHDRDLHPGRDLDRCGRCARQLRQLGSGGAS